MVCKKVRCMKLKVLFEKREISFFCFCMTHNSHTVHLQFLSCLYFSKVSVHRSNAYAIGGAWNDAGVLFPHGNT